MFFLWLKRYMPRSLYGRAFLILLLPVVVVQLVVSVLFAQRHFTDVTQQMTRTMIREIRLVLDTVNETTSAKDVRQALEDRLPGIDISVELLPDAQMPSEDTRLWYDFSGTVFGPMLRTSFPELERILLADDRFVLLYMNTKHGVGQFTIIRRRMSAAKPHQLYVNMIFFGLVTTLIAFLYLRNQLRPITRLANAAEAFGRGRHIPYSPSGATEVRAAGAAFLDMRNRIERHIEQRTLMLSGVSHDLRTPLTRMKLELSLLAPQDRAPLERDVEDMQRLVDEFLSFVQGASEGDPEPLDPIDLIQDLVQNAQRAGRDVTVYTLEGTGLVDLRETAIRRAVDNLIGNAVRYGTRAEVSVHLTPRSVRFRVEDDGPGIAEDLRAQAQKPFVRLDPARNQNLGSGVGLGLAIATDIARAHGGVLRLASSDRLGGLCADIVIAR
ncbi:MAG: ATP-binding protein [Paracoccaceae bacterium]